MYEYLNGFVSDVQPGYVVLDVNGVGYLLNVADPYQYHVDLEKKVKIYIHQVITDSYQALYGFYDRKAKLLFERLINVSGIGPKSANAILAGNQGHALLNAINEENITFLTKFPGVGKKTAKQIVLDLKGKLDDLLENDLFQPDVDDDEIGLNINTQLQEALSALRALGYTERDVKKVEKHFISQPNKSTNDYLSLGLKILTGM